MSLSRLGKTRKWLYKVEVRVLLFVVETQGEKANYIFHDYAPFVEDEANYRNYMARFDQNILVKGSLSGNMDKRSDFTASISEHEELAEHTGLAEKLGISVNHNSLEGNRDVSKGKNNVNIVLLPKKDPKKALAGRNPNCCESKCRNQSMIDGLCMIHWNKRQNLCQVKDFSSLAIGKESICSEPLKESGELIITPAQEKTFNIKEGSSEDASSILFQALAKATALRDSDHFPSNVHSIMPSVKEEGIEEEKSVQPCGSSESQQVQYGTNTLDYQSSLKQELFETTNGSIIDTNSILNCDDRDIVNILGEMRSKTGSIELGDGRTINTVGGISRNLRGISDSLVNKESFSRSREGICLMDGCKVRALVGGYCEVHGAKQSEITASSSSSKGSTFYKKICSVENCNFAAHRGGLCSSHGGYISCSVEGCVKQTVAGGLCWVHGGDPRKECSVKGCTTLVNRGGLCAKHGESPRCNVEACQKQAISGGLCWTHGGGSGKQCSVSGCSTLAQKGGLCCKHGGNSKKPCSVEGCNTRANLWGLCGKHGGYRRCSVEGCDKAAKAGGLCMAHGGGTTSRKAKVQRR